MFFQDGLICAVTSSSQGTPNQNKKAFFMIVQENNYFWNQTAFAALIYKTRF
jgi:hypothetical protein